MKKAARQIAALALALLIVCLLSRAAFRGGYTAYVPVPQSQKDLKPQSLRFELSSPGIVSPGVPQLQDGYLRMPIQPEAQGETFIEIRSERDDNVAMMRLRVGRFGTVYDVSTGGFTGDTVVLAAFTAFCLAVALIMFRAYRQAKGPDFYSYGTIYAAGFSMFALMTGLVMLIVTLRRVLHPASYTMLSAYSAICSASYNYMLLTAPFILAFSVAMAVSNIALLRHEQMRLKNALGICVALLLVVGGALGLYLHGRDFMGSEWEMRVRNTVDNVYCTVFVYFECMLIGAIVCGVKAARNVPAADKDFILILGCQFRRDGTLTPLLQGRVDRAIDFWREHVAAGRRAVLMPTGGQGRNEPMAEAEAMRRYLLSRGVPEDAILPEDRSRNTYQNMEFCKALIEARGQGAKAAYVTTNYHVFRSGVWARLAGLPAEGLGSRTKGWYWPNAFMRECVGLLMNRIPQELVLLAAMLALFGALSMALV